MLGVAAGARRPTTAARPSLRWQRLRAGRPHRGARQYAGSITQSQGADLLAQARVVAIARIQQHHAARNTSRASRAYLRERDLRLGLEADLLGNARLVPAGGVLRPGFRQIQPITHRQARIVIGDRQRYRGLAIVLLAELAAILPRHAHRVPALLRKAGIVDDPRLDRAVPLDLRQRPLAHLGQNLLVRPGRLPDKMQKRLMLRRRPLGRRDRRHRLHTLALARHHQPDAIVPQRTRPISVTDHARKRRHVPCKPRLALVPSKTHLGSPAKNKSRKSIRDLIHNTLRRSNSPCF